jgi:hypothetical protein
MQSLRFDNRFIRDLPADPETGSRVRQVHGALHSPVMPTPVAAPRLIAHSREVAALLGITEDEVASADFARVFGGNALVEGMAPYAANYGGHQFGHWAGQLGDGRAITLGELINARRRALGAATQGRRTNAVFAQRRRSRRAAFVGARVPLQRGDASPRHSHHAGIEPGRDR